jgi:hypothetical protein
MAKSRKVTKVSNSKPSKTRTAWDERVYKDKQSRACIDLILDGVKRRYLVQDLVCQVYHGPRPYPHSVVHLIDSSKPCTPDNVGWLTQNPGERTPSQSADSAEAKKVKRPLKRPKERMEWDHLFSVDEEGALYLDATSRGECRRVRLEEFLSKRYRGPWPAQDSYGYIIDLSKGSVASNVGWMTQNPAFRTVKYG